MPEVDEIDIGCCFCDQALDPNETYIITVNRSDIEQYWWGHLSCFREALDIKYRTFRPEFEKALGLPPEFGDFNGLGI